MKAAGFARPARGSVRCGHQVVVLPERAGLLAAVIDGLGHGAESWATAMLAGEVIAERRNFALSEIMALLHGELRRTRGAAVGLMRISEGGRAEFCGIGSVEVQAVSGGPPPVFSSAGIVGHNLRNVRVHRFTMQPADVLCMHSDGVSSRDGLGEVLGGSVEEMARRIVERFGRAHDDAAALVIAREE